MKLFTAIVNDARLLGHFLAHYEDAGVTDFFIAATPRFASEIERFAERYRIVVHTDLAVNDTVVGEVSGVSEMRRRYQRPDEWIILADLDELIELDGQLTEILELADAENADVVRAVMWDRFTADGRVVGFASDRPLAESFPVRARFIATVMRGAGFKGVLVKGLIESLSAHHTFANEVVCSRQLEISHYKWIEGSIERLQQAYETVVKAGRPWAVQYARVLEHYSAHGRFAWEEFGGELVGNSRPARERGGPLGSAGEA